MTKISHIEDKKQLAYCFNCRDFSFLKEKVHIGKNELKNYVEKNDQIYGYKINKIEQLTNIYNFNVYAVNFEFSELSVWPTIEEFSAISNMLLLLKKDIDISAGYYILKIPAHMLYLINMVSETVGNYIFAGTTKCYTLNQYIDKQFKEDDTRILLANDKIKLVYGEQLKMISQKSFENHKGQYHISEITRDKAVFIYKNWIDQYINSSDDIIVAFSGENIVGFLAIDEDENYIEGSLGAVDSNYRNMHIYEKMERMAVQISIQKNKIFVTSTQLENYIIQKAENNIGLIHYYSFHNIHINNLNAKEVQIISGILE